ncbi:MAG: exo-alpha-sialidase [Thermoguttaceae bacterium]|nr:exo-alpha-sialidase [Thermoguttaceae bacterium]MDW8036966.1 exo-alpha-sialidase [Thermoguttaceae bacterium]
MSPLVKGYLVVGYGLLGWLLGVALAAEPVQSADPAPAAQCRQYKPSAADPIQSADPPSPSAHKEQKPENPMGGPENPPVGLKHQPKGLNRLPEGGQTPPEKLENQPEEVVFVADGKPELVEAVGQKWTQGEGFLEGRGPGNVLRTVRAIGSGDFHLKLELSLFQLERSGASIVLGEGNHFGFSSGNARLFVEGPIFPGGQQVLEPTERYIRDGQRFRLEIIRKGNQMRFLIDGREVYSMISDGGPIGQVSLRPWRSQMQVHQFTATGRILDIPRTGSVPVPGLKPGHDPASGPLDQSPSAIPKENSPPDHPASANTAPTAQPGSLEQKQRPTSASPAVSPDQPTAQRPKSVETSTSETQASKTPPANEPKEKEIEHVDVYISGQDGYHTYRIPSVLVTPKGTVLAFCEGRKHSRSDTGDIDLLVKRSEDGGRTFSAQHIVWDDGPNTCGNPCPVVDQKTGTIWLLMTHNLGEDKEPDIVARKSKGTRTVWVTHSTDDGRTWAKPVEITQKVKKPQWTWYATGPGCGIQLRTGRLVIPCDHIADDGWWGSHIIYSDDSGKTWQLGGATGPKTNECEVVELADARLMLNMRNYNREHTCRAVAYSADGGLTWSAVSYDATLIEPICQASIRRYSLADPERPGSKNVLIFSNPADPKERKKMTLRLSFDEGKSWPVAKLLWPGPAAYSCLAVLPDGTVLCLYERGEKHPYERISLAHIPADQLQR